MSIDEQELRRRLEETADRAAPPRFSTGDLTRRIRRRRARVVAAVAGAGAVAAIAVAVPIALGGTSKPVISNPVPLTPEPVFTVAVNGQAQPRRQPRFVITPAEGLTITVDVTVPAHVTVTALWLGITNGMLSPRPDGPASMSPVLAARTGTRLLPGVHRFTLHWVTPGGLRPGSSRQLSAAWAWPDGLRPAGEAEGIIAVLDVQNASGA